MSLHGTIWMGSPVDGMLPSAPFYHFWIRYAGD